MEFPVNEFLAKQEHELAGRIKSYPAMSNNVSAIGHPCVRYLVYKRTRGDEGDPYSTDLQALFDEGNAQEKTTMMRIMELGYRYERSQETFGFKDLEIRGKMDGEAIMLSGGRVVGKWAAEIKKVNGYAWDKLNSWEDLYSNWWHMKWLVQLQLAILHVATKPGYDDSGVLFLKNTEKNLIKPIAVPMRQDLIDGAFEKAKKINAHMKAGTVPDRCDYTLGICKGCEFRTLCSPDENFLAGENIQDPTFISKLQRRELLEEPAREFGSIDREIKEILRGKVYAVAGPFRISGKEYGKGWKCEIERVMSDSDMDKIAPIMERPKAPAKPAAPAPANLSQPEHPDFGAFMDRIGNSKTQAELTEVKNDFQSVHAKQPFSTPEMDTIKSQFKSSFIRIKKSAPPAKGEA